MGRKVLSAIMAIGLTSSIMGCSTSKFFDNSNNINNDYDTGYKFGNGKKTPRKKRGSKNKKKF